MLGLDRITFDPQKMNGQACIRGLRIPVATVLRCIAAGMSVEEVIADYPELTQADIEQSLEFARG